MPIHPTRREARSELYEWAKYAQTLLTNRNKLPSRKMGRRPQITASDWVKKHETPITKTPQPRPPFSAL
jgi:hypothetical protein